MINKYREALEDMTWQFAHKGVIKGKSALFTGGLSTLEGAFETLGWDDPHFVEDCDGVICDVEGCMEFATTGGINWHDKGYWRLCSEHAFSKETCPKMKQRAIDRENQRDTATGNLPMKSIEGNKNERTN